MESSGHEIEFKALEAETIFGCHARFLSLEHDISNYLTVNAGFDESTGTYVCYFTPVEYENQIELALDVELSVTPGYSTGMEIGDRLQLSFVTAFKVLTTELALTNVQPTSHIEIKGLSTNLENVNVELSHPHLLKKGRGYIDSFDDSITDIGGYLQKYNLPITVKSAFWNGGKESLSANMYALISTESQSVKLPVVVRFRSDKCGNMDLGWSTVFYFLIDHYQSFLLILFSCFACTYITRFVISKQQNTIAKDQKQAPTNINSNLLQQSPLPSSPRYGSAAGAGLNLTSADNKPYLWTVDKTPVYGSPNGTRRSPRPLTGYGQYSYTE